MRPIRHPIAIFVVAVLVVIGIGVGVVAATMNQKVYGPSWGRFTAAFHGRVYDGFQTAQMGRNSGALSPTHRRLRSTRLSRKARTGYAPLSIPSEMEAVYGVDVSAASRSSAFAAAAVRSAKNALLPCWRHGIGDKTRTGSWSRPSDRSASRANARRLSS